MDFLHSANRPRNSYFPPPVARSPVKTGLSGSPRRSPGLRSSSPQSDVSSLAGAQGVSRQESSPLTTRSVNAGRSNQKNATLRNLKTQALPLDFSDGEGADQVNDENGDAFAPMQPDFADSFDDSIANDDGLPDSIGPGQNDLDGDSSLMEVRSRQTARNAPTSSTNSKGAGAKKNNNNPKPAKRGRPPKSHRSADEEAANPRPAKKPRTSGQGSQSAREPLEPELNQVVENYANRTGPLKGRSLYILKREMPTGDSATHTRSGRVSVRPLAYWKNERCVFGDGEAAEGQRYPLSTIKEVIRTEELEPDRKQKGKRTGRKPKSRKHHDDASDEEEDEDADDWEKQGGILHGYVQKWNPETQTGSKDEEVLGKEPIGTGS